MNSLYSDIFAITRAALYGTEPALSKDADFGRIYSVLLRNKLVPVTYKAASKLEELPQEILSFWKRNTMTRALRQMCMTSELRNLLLQGKSRNVELIVFKGLAVAALYPDPNMRTSSDADILVDAQQRPAAEALLKELGFEETDEGSKDHVPVFVKNGTNYCMKIELHDCLWEDYEGKQAKILDSLELAKAETLIEQTGSGVTFTTLGIDEHLIFQIYHIVKHLFFEGISLRYFTDIALYVNSYYDRINWKVVREKLRLLHYERFFDCILIMCQRYLGMREDVPFVEPVTDEMLDKLIEDVLGDKEEVSEKDAWETINFLDRYFMRNTAVKQSKFQQRRKQILPFPSELNEKFSYAKKCPILLPVAWVHRVIYFIGYKRDCKKYGKDAEGAMKKSQKRLDLMRDLALMDTDKEQKR